MWRWCSSILRAAFPASITAPSRPSTAATDPNDREDMFDGQFEQGPSLGDNFNMTHPQFQMVARLEQFPPALSGAANRLARQPVE